MPRYTLPLGFLAIGNSVGVAVNAVKASVVAPQRRCYAATVWRPLVGEGLKPDQPPASAAIASLHCKMVAGPTATPNHKEKPHAVAQGFSDGQGNLGEGDSRTGPSWRSNAVTA